MADGYKKQVWDAIVNAIMTVSGIGAVVKNVQSWNDFTPDQLPAVLVQMKVSTARISFDDATALDREAIFEFALTGIVFDSMEDPDSVLDALATEVEEAIATDVALRTLVSEVEPLTEQRDIGLQEKYGFFKSTVAAVGYYNHRSP